MPKISVILPVYNVEPYITRCFESLQNQTLSDLEFICIDDCSTDNSLKILKEYEKSDNRFKVIAQENNSGAAAARNKGLEIATGEYLSFIDPDDAIDLNFYEELYKKVEQSSPDIIKCQRKNIYQDGSSYISNLNESIKTNGILDFCGEWTTAIYKHAMIKQNNITFRENIKKSQDIVFLNDVVLKANSIKVVNGIYYYYYRRNNSLNAKSISTEKIKIGCLAVKTILEEVNNLLYKKVPDSLYTNYYAKQMYSLFNFVFQNNSLEAKYYCIDAMINAFYGCKSKQNLKKIFKYQWMLAYIERKKTNELTKCISEYNNVQELFNPPIQIIVSLTSYPARIDTVHLTIESIMNQTLKPKKIVLCLSDIQFPNKIDSLPDNLKELLNKNLEIIWYHQEQDHRCFNKIIPTLKKYPNDIIVTVDDDIIYAKNCIENLYKTWLKYPNCVIANRTHYIKYNKKQILPYNQWENCSDYNKPTFNLLQTGVGGVLYFPGCFHKDVLRDDLFLKLSKNTDDLWLWAMLVLKGTKIKHSQECIKYNVIPNSQACGLWKTTNSIGGNDANLKLLLKHYPKIEKRLEKDNHFYNNHFERIFSIKNSFDKTHKIITIFGIKIKLKKDFFKKLLWAGNKSSKDNKWYKVIYILGIKFSFRNKKKEIRLAEKQEKEQIINRLNYLKKQNAELQINLKAQYENFTKQNAELKHELKAQYENFTNQNNELAKQNAELKHELKAQYENLTNQNNELAKQNAELKYELKNKFKLLQENYKEQNNQLNKKIKKIETSYNDFKSDVIEVFEHNQLKRIKNSERILPEFYNSIEEYNLYIKHLFAYANSINYISDNFKVLEIGCGDGYGADLISKNNTVDIIATDIVKNTIKEANFKYGKENLKFELYDGNELKYNDNTFDVVVSFQVIEHVTDVDKYLQNIKRVLKPNGKLLITTPCAKYRLADGQKPWNKYHLREYYLESIYNDMKKVFPNTEIYSIKANSPLMEIEKERCRKNRTDYDGKRQKIEYNENYMEQYSIKDYYLDNNNIDDGLDFFILSTK